MWETNGTGSICCSFIAVYDAVAHYALGHLGHKVLSTEYRLTLPDAKVLVKEISRTRRALSAGKRLK